MASEGEFKQLRLSQAEEAKKLHAENAAAEESEEEDDEDDEPPPDFFKPQAHSGKARTSVSAEAYGAWNQQNTEFVPPTIEKTADQKARISAVLQNSFMFSNLGDKELEKVIGAMAELNVKDNERVIEQGGDGDSLFVVEKGDLDCIIGDKVVKTCGTGDVFGELALLYNCPRSASVQSKGNAVLWQLDRDTFNHIVKASAQKKRERYDAFLAKVPLLASMDGYERSQISDALQSEVFAAGSDIVKAGEVGNKFYIIEEGEAKAIKAGAEVMKYGVGDYFGELALIRDQPRAATVTAQSQVKALSVDGRAFKRLLNVQDLLERSTKYT